MATIYGTNVYEASYGTSSSDTIYGWAMGSSAASDTGNDMMWGREGNDWLFGGGGNDWLFGGDHNDNLDGGAGEDDLNGNDGDDTVWYAGATVGVSVNLLEGEGYDGEAAGDMYWSIENVVGSQYHDVLVGDDLHNTLVGLGGSDSLVGNGGRDWLSGGAGIDYLYGGGDDDTLDDGAERGTSYGNAGNDVFLGSGGGDTFYGGGDRDTAYYVNAATAVDVDLLNNVAHGGDAEGDRYFSIEDLWGGRFGDTLSGTDGDNFILPGDGDDRVWGNGGNDTIIGDPGGDRLVGGGDIDTVVYGSLDGLLEPIRVAVEVNLATGIGRFGDAEDDTLFGIENVIGTGSNDTITGDVNANRLTGAGGGDILTGGGGADTFAYRRTGDGTMTVFDEILDFSRAEGDRIDLRAIDANGSAPGDMFDFVDAFTGVAGQLRVDPAGGSWNVFGDTDGDGMADFRIRAYVALVEGDFML